MLATLGTSASDELKPLNRSRCFEEGETVLAKWFTARKYIWSPGVIKRKIGNRMYEIYFNDFDTLGTRHVDQILKCKEPRNVEEKRIVHTQDSYVNTPVIIYDAPERPPPPPPSPRASSSSENVGSEGSREQSVTEAAAVSEGDESNSAGDAGGGEGEGMVTCDDNATSSGLERTNDVDESSANVHRDLDDVNIDIVNNNGRTLRPRKNVDYKQYF